MHASLSDSENTKNTENTPRLTATAQGRAAVDFLSRTGRNLWVVGPAGVGKSRVCTHVAGALHGGRARTLSIDARNPGASLLRQCLSHSWALRGYVRAALWVEAHAPSEWLKGPLLPSQDMCLAVLSDVLIAEQEQELEVPFLPALLLIDDSHYNANDSVQMSDRTDLGDRRDDTDQATTMTSSTMTTTSSTASTTSQLERLARLARDLNSRGASQAVMTTRLIRTGTRCRLPLAGRHQGCGVMHLTDWTLEATKTEEEAVFVLAADDNDEDAEIETVHEKTINSVRSFLSFLNDDLVTNDAARSVETLEDHHRQPQRQGDNNNDDHSDMAAFIFGCIGGNLRKLANFVHLKHTRGISAENLCAELLDNVEMDLRYQLFDEHDYFEIEANHVDPASPRIDASARHFSALDILLGDQIGVSSVANTMQPVITSRGLRSFAEVFKAFDGGEDAALDVAFYQYMTLVPPRRWEPLTVVVGGNKEEEEEEEEEEFADVQRDMPASQRNPPTTHETRKGKAGREEESLPIFEWVDLLDPDGDKWRVRADFLTLKAFEEFLETATTDHGGDDGGSSSLLERLRALQQLRFMRADTRQMLEEERMLAHEAKVTKEAWDRAAGMRERGEIDDEKHLAVQLKLDTRRRRHRTVDATLRRRAVVIREREHDARSVLLRQRQRQCVQIVL